MNDPWPRPTQGPAKTIETDYLVIGAGAMGMAFTDTLITESGARVVMIDRACQPGGHWTTAYPFVRLHQPSAYYGVNSRALGNNTIDLVGWNQGLNELAPVGEICAYFDAVLQQQLLPTGRVDYFPMSEYLGDGRFRTLAGTEYVVTVNRRIVDATYLRAVVPSMRPAPYSVAPGVDCVAPNELPKLGTRDRYVVVGAGKTGMDVCLWLLRNDVCPDKLTWIMPRDSWLIDRATLQPGPTFVRQFRESYGATLEAIGAATSTDDLFDRLETAGTLLRIDPSVRPSMYRCATVSHLELEQLRRIRDIVRMGHVQRIEPTTIPSRLTDDCIARFGSTTENHRLKWRPWLTGPNIDGTETPFPLRRTDIDPFEHVNNTIYWHGVHEILCQIPTLTAPYRAVLEYRSPIKSGEPLTIRYEQHDDVVRMHFVVGDDVRAAALLRRL